MLEWYTTLLTFNQAKAVWLASIPIFWVALSVWFLRVNPDDKTLIGAALMASIFVYPALYWILWCVVGFLNEIGWLWAH